MNQLNCFVVLNGCYPVEVFIDRNDALAFINRWNGRNSHSNLYMYRCPLSHQASATIPFNWQQETKRESDRSESRKQLGMTLCSDKRLTEGIFLKNA